VGNLLLNCNRVRMSFRGTWQSQYNFFLVIVGTDCKSALSDAETNPSGLGFVTLRLTEYFFRVLQKSFRFFRNFFRESIMFFCLSDKYFCVLEKYFRVLEISFYVFQKFFRILRKIF
jgi:hypothetical protein